MSLPFLPTDQIIPIFNELKQGISADNKLNLVMDLNLKKIKIIKKKF